MLSCYAIVIALAESHPAGPNLLRNPGFESVPNGNLGQGLLPSDWLQTGPTVPGADTYSSDGAYGLRIEEFGNWGAGMAPYEGARFVAGWSIGQGESFGQVLSARLQPLGLYRCTAWLRDSVRPNQNGNGGYELMLHDGKAAFVPLGKLWALGQGANRWQFASVTFVTPPISASYAVFVFRPIHEGFGPHAYFACDDVSLSQAKSPVPSNQDGL
jgi:hypothetical protein